MQSFIKVKFRRLLAVIGHCRSWIDYKIWKHCSTRFGCCCVLSTNYRESIVFCYQSRWNQKMFVIAQGTKKKKMFMFVCTFSIDPKFWKTWAACSFFFFFLESLVCCFSFLFFSFLFFFFFDIQFCIFKQNC